jgi:hypothetical protein
MDSRISDSLTELGFTENCIVETIMVTMNEDGSSNPAPMGITMQEELAVKVYHTSQTYLNLLKGGSAYLNVISDPLLFLRCAFKEEFPEQVIVCDGLVVGAEAIIYTEIVGPEIEKDQYTVFSLTPQIVKIIKPKPIAFSRGRASAIEAIIDATRIQVFHMDGKAEDVKRLVERMKNHIDTMEKVSCSDSAEAEVIRQLVFMIKEWGVNW